MEFDRDAVIQSFAVESEEGLSSAEAALLELEGHPEQDEHVAQIFRVVHTLKGNAVLLGFEALSKFAHEVEDVLHRVRSKELTITAKVVSTLLASVDALRVTVAACLSGAQDVVPAYQSLRSRLAELNIGGEPILSQPQMADAPHAPELPKAHVSMGTNRTLRVSVEKLDQLLNLTGEITIARGRMRQMLIEHEAGDKSLLLDSHSDVDRLFLELQGAIMRARMVPLGPVFQQCTRAVRDIALKLGKQAQVTISGEEVEVDTSVTELIRDPLVHMIRNALDHGIEAPEERRAAGKHPRGNIELSAEHQGGTIVIELRDDGRGIDLDAVRVRAQAERMLGENERLSEEELYRFLFRGGFSTATQISDMSGRGVGLEVVRRNIEALRGSVQISSERGCGTAIRIRLPLTLAIVEAFLIGVGTETYVIPLESTVECLDLPRECIAGPNGSAVIDFRGRPLPLLRLRHVLEVSSPIGTREKVLVVRHNDLLAGLVVDEFYGQLQVVIKSLGLLTPTAYGISGSTILGNGQVALLLDIPKLLSDAVELTTTQVELS